MLVICIQEISKTSENISKINYRLYFIGSRTPLAAPNFFALKLSLLPTSNFPLKTNDDDNSPLVKNSC